MKNVLKVLLSLVFVVCMVSVGFAGSSANVNSHADGHGVDFDVVTLPSNSGIAGGISGATGSADAQAQGRVYGNGHVKVNVDTLGGGLTDTTAYSGTGSGSIYNGSYSNSYGITGANVDVKVKGQGGVAGSANGSVTQGSLNGSLVKNSPQSGWSSDGHSLGVAGQLSHGSFYGEAGAESGGGSGGGSGKAGFSTTTEMIGNSYSESFRYMTNDQGSHTEGMGSNVGASTQVNSTNDQYSNRRGYTSVTGSYSVIGGAASKTVQSTNTGSASASTIGIYTGGGSVGSSYTGKAAGYTNTSVTTQHGMNGTISTSSAGMKVKSVGSNSHQP